VGAGYLGRRADRHGITATGEGAAGRHSSGGRLAALAAVAALVALLVPPVGAEASSPQRISSWSPAPGIVHETYRWNLSRGPVVINVVRYDRTDDRVEMTPELARGRVPGLETTTTAMRRLGAEAVAGVNAHFFFCNPGPCGDPQGLLVRNSDFISEPEAKSWARGWLGGFVTYDDGGYALGRPQFRGVLTQPDGVEVPIAGVNRHPVRPTSTNSQLTEVTLLDRAMGGSTGTPRGTTELVVREFRADWQVDGTWVVTGVSTAGNATIPSDGAVLAASGSLGARLANVRVGDRIGIRLDSTRTWRTAQHGVSAGPLLILDGRLLPESDWNTEGFGDGHNRSAHPRTAVGFRGDGQNLLVTADGRQPGYSVGLTTAETRHLMQFLGARDALMLDGGGSTTMSIEGALTNRPSDPGGARSVASHLVVWSRDALPPPETAHACPDGRVPDSPFADTSGNAHEDSIDCVHWWGVASGRSEDTYAPGLPVSRAQMATFIANAIEEAGGDLPEDGEGFRDVAGTNPHAAAIRRLAAAGVVSGYPDGSYRPNDTVTRAQMTTFLVRAYERVSGGTLRSSERYFRDTDGNVHRTNIMAAAEAGFTAGTRPRTFSPQAGVTRAQMASFIARTLNRKVVHTDAVPPDEREAETTSAGDGEPGGDGAEPGGPGGEG
jgi:hypothetical protein